MHNFKVSSDISLFPKYKDLNSSTVIPISDNLDNTFDNIVFLKLVFTFSRFSLLMSETILKV